VTAWMASATGSDATTRASSLAFLSSGVKRGRLWSRACLVDLASRSGQGGFVTDRLVLTDEMWARLEPLLPDRTPRRGGRWRDHREVIEAIIWRFRTGSPWRDLPEEMPPWVTVWGRFDRWSKDGTWDLILRELQGQAHAVAELEWTVSLDSTIARAHQHAAGARHGRTSTGGSVELQDPLARTR
jgi:transposase